MQRDQTRKPWLLFQVLSGSLPPLPHCTADNIFIIYNLEEPIIASHLETNSHIIKLDEVALLIEDSFLCNSTNRHNTPI